MKRSLFLLMTLLSAFLAKGQSDDNVTLDFYGFVRVDAYMDTYKGVDAGHDIFYLLPLYGVKNGAEYNNQLSSNISAMASRLGVRINFPEVLKAKCTGLLEFDFAGNLKADPSMFRIRQAYSLMTWEKSSLLIGQTWHPFFGGSCLPTVAGLNTGAPFTCFNRSPMIRFNKKFGGLTVSASAVGQMQYNSPAIDATDFNPNTYQVSYNQAKRNGVIPELVLSAEWTKNTITLGAGAEYNRIKPRMMTTDTSKVSSVAEEYLNSTAFMAYGRYKKDKLTILLKGYYGENMSFLTLPGGYGVATRDAATQKETYTSYKTYTTAINIVYGQKWQFGLFAGYGGNLGTKAPLCDAKTYGLFQTMQTMYRVAPHISFNLPKFRVIAEYERTSANYGTGAINLADGLYAKSHAVTDNRVISVFTQYF
jgi:hypothetical protein